LLTRQFLPGYFQTRLPALICVRTLFQSCRRMLEDSAQIPAPFVSEY